jgi:hypothetical protein
LFDEDNPITIPPASQPGLRLALTAHKDMTFSKLHEIAVADSTKALEDLHDSVPRTQLIPALQGAHALGQCAERLLTQACGIILLSFAARRGDAEPKAKRSKDKHRDLQRQRSLIDSLQRQLNTFLSSHNKQLPWTASRVANGSSSGSRASPARLDSGAGSTAEHESTGETSADGLMVGASDKWMNADRFLACIYLSLGVSVLATEDEADVALKRAAEHAKETKSESLREICAHFRRWHGKASVDTERKTSVKEVSVAL